MFIFFQHGKGFPTLIQPISLEKAWNIRTIFFKIAEKRLKKSAGITHLLAEYKYIYN